MGRLTLNMLMSFAEFEREMIGDRTRDKIAASRRKGKWTGGPVPFGYDVVDKHLVVNDFEALVVREAFALLVEHRQMSGVARTLNERGHTPKGARNPTGKAPRWSKDSIARVLRNPLYAGFMRYGDERHPGEHPAIIDAETFRRAEKIVDAGEHGQVSHGLNPAYVLRGLLHCGSCGAAMSPGSTRNGDREYRYYRCSTRDKHGSEVCAAPPLPAGAVEAYVVDRIAGASVDGALAAEVELALNGRIERRRAALTMLRAKLPSRIANASANASKLADEMMRLTGKAREIIEGKLRVETEKATESERHLAETERELADLKGLAADRAWVVAALSSFGKVWAALSLPNRGRLLRALVERVVVDEASRKAEVHLIDFAAMPDESLPAPKEAA